MTCKVLFLGAGASVGVGKEHYPLCNQIFDFLEEYKNKFGVNVNYKDDWDRFDQFRKKHSPRFDDLKVEEFYSKLENIISNNDPLKSECEQVQLALSRMIFFRFGYNNYNYADFKKEQILNYLENMVMDCNYIISLNWDNLCEFILSDHALWSPTDGYGIPVNLIETRPRKRINGIRQQPTEHNVICSQSKVIILKLHGSMGWKLKAPNYLDINYDPKIHKDELFLTDFDFLRHIPNIKSSCNIKFQDKIKDKNTPEPPGKDYYSNPCVIYPSYNKPYEKFPVLIPIWDEAKKVLQKATEVIFVGYSLPDDDKPIRELISILIDRINFEEVKAKCIIGQKDENSIKTAERYQQLLGSKIDIIYENAQDYFKQTTSYRFWQYLTTIYHKCLSCYKSCFFRSKK